MSRSRPIAFTLSLITLATTAWAQPAPDAGRLLREQAAPAKPAPVPTPAPQAPATAEDTDAGPRVLVKTLSFSGATLVGEAELQAALADTLGQTLSLGQLRARATRITALYLARGRLARVVIPPQAAADGHIRLNIVEARAGQVRVDGDAGLNTTWLQALAAGQLSAGEPLTMPALSMAQALVAEQPGISSQATLVPGRGDGEVDLQMRVARTPFLRGFAELSNSGDPTTGRVRVVGGLSLDNPSGRFDSARLLLSATEGVNFADAAYSLPLGTQGLRVGGQASALNYREDRTDARGSGQVFGINASQALQRQPSRRLSVSGQLSRKHLKDRVAGVQTGDRRLTVANIGLSGTRTVAWPGPSMLQWEATLLAGRLNLGGNPDALVADQATRRSHGNFQTLNWRLQQGTLLGGGWTLGGALRGQFASRNLDSSERFALGGLQGVRAYPGHEGAGDAGWLFSLDMERQLHERVNLRVFFDHGRTQLNHRPWVGWDSGKPGQRNRYGLSGIGIGGDWRLAPGASATLSLAQPVGSNPGRDSQGRESDGRRSGGLRAWASLSYAL